MVAAYHEGEIWSDMAFRRPHYESRQSVVEIRLQKPSIPNSKSDICIVDNQVSNGPVSTWPAAIAKLGVHW